MLADKDFEANAAVTLYAADGTVDYASEAGDRIGGRGNSTWKLPKKPFNLKLGQKAGLLGMGDAKKWSLLANAYDETNLRNKLVLDFAREIAPYRGFSPECAFVDLYRGRSRPGRRALVGPVHRARKLPGRRGGHDSLHARQDSLPRRPLAG